MNIEEFKNDWRNMGQEEYLLNKILIYVHYSEEKYKNKELRDHEHCDFCFEKISFIEDALHWGYHTEDNHNWICEECYNEFKDIFHWIVISDEK